MDCEASRGCAPSNSRYSRVVYTSACRPSPIALEAASAASVEDLSYYVEQTRVILRALDVAWP
jgi:hypothetical protein